MEWVETVGRTIEEAQEAALDQLGVAEDEAEFEILEEPRSGLFGRLRSEARVRARVRPKAPPPKLDRRDRRRKASRGGGRSRSEGERSSGEDAQARGAKQPSQPPATRSSSESGSADRGRSRHTSRDQDATSTEDGDTMTHVDGEGPSLDEQAGVIEEFVNGLLDAFEAEGDVTTAIGAEDRVEVRITGDDLGLLIGPKGETLNALQELARTVAQRHAAGSGAARVRVDVNGYRKRRQEALERFTRQVADEVRASGSEKALEAMNAADRKIVHDTVNEIDGVTTMSEGEEPRRRVVILPER